ncbi:MULTISPECIES: hypothetical protein [Herpetosiphon]|uniref:Uncharacterized protein n=1 Tax=Herpetosiphon geysericola TaxID=70996 RepID=A0A0P6YB54_9CHLR|nr:MULTISPECIES: hypothetical protein [Herpetosiphon]KPL86644.1 hypothetical protein SE18_11655 [Herpetosiphon geysericola]MBM7843945.1 hypothetical protein [Herpetosiphon giganteus]
MGTRVVILHLSGEDPIVAEMEDDPQPTDAFIRVSNMRRRDGKDVPYIGGGVQSVIYPWHRVTFIEMMVSEEERGNVIDFFRDA